MDKFIHLTTDNVTGQEPGTLVSRFVGDVDTVENLFTSGIISMFADICKLVSILTVIWFRNRGRRSCCWHCCRSCLRSRGAYQKSMLAAQMENRKAVGQGVRTCAGNPA